MDIKQLGEHVRNYLAEQHDAELAEWKIDGDSVRVEVHDTHQNTILWDLKFLGDESMVIMQSCDTGCVCLVSAKSWVVGAILLS